LAGVEEGPAEAGGAKRGVELIAGAAARSTGTAVALVSHGEVPFVATLALAVETAGRTDRNLSVIDLNRIVHLRIIEISLPGLQLSLVDIPQIRAISSLHILRQIVSLSSSSLHHQHLLKSSIRISNQIFYIDLLRVDISSQKITEFSQSIIDSHDGFLPECKEGIPDSYVKSSTVQQRFTWHDNSAGTESGVVYAECVYLLG
jgi:hypothetical protein